MSELMPTREDIEYRRLLPLYVSPDKLPLSLVYGGRRICGIPDDFKPRVTRELVDAALDRVTVTGEKDGLKLTAICSQYRDFPVCSWVAYAENTSDAGSPIIEDFKAIDTVFAGEDPVFTHGNGDTCGEDGYEFWSEPLKEEKAVSPSNGLPCQGASPFMKLTFDGYQLRFGIGWPAMWEVRVSPEEGGARFVLGQKRCHMKLLPGEVIRTPRADILAASDDERGRNLWRRWYFAHILPREHGHPLTPKLCLHTWMIDKKPEFTGATEANQLSGIDDYLRQGLKPDIWWIDAGWYPCNFDWPFTGTWKENPEHFPNSLGPVGQKCDDNGIQLLLWFEPERVRDHTELSDEHPQWVLKANPGDDQGLLNLGDPECRAWITDRVDAVIKRAHVRVYRQDFNFNPLPIWEAREAPDRVGAMENAHVQGYLRYWDDLLFRNPDLWIDSCASGGRRNEMETLRRAVPLHYTDVGYGKHPVKQKQHRLMFEWIPYFRAHTMNWDNAEGGYDNGGKPVDEYAYQCAMAPAITSMVEHDAPAEQFELARRYDRIWRRAAAIMLSGDYYPLTECRRDPHDWYAMQFDDPRQRVGFIQAVRNTQCESESITLYPKLEGETYTFENMQTGEIRKYKAFGLRSGFTVSIPRRSGVIWFYRY